VALPTRVGRPAFAALRPLSIRASERIDLRGGTGVGKNRAGGDDACDDITGQPASDA
jgi:hypothetical protein